MYRTLSPLFEEIKAIHPYRLCTIKELENGKFKVLTRSFDSLQAAKDAVDGTYSGYSKAIKTA